MKTYKGETTPRNIKATLWVFFRAPPPLEQILISILKAL